MKLKIDSSAIQDARNIVSGAFYPLKGFLRELDFKSVLDKMRLNNGDVWSIPVVLDISEKDYETIKKENVITLANKDNSTEFLLKNIEIYTYNKNEFAKKLFGTNDLEHPGVKEVMNKGKYLVGGELSLVFDNEKSFEEYNHSPEETKKEFKNKGWKTVVAFQTRNIPHRSHEFLQKLALQHVDGLFVQPVIGKKKTGDFKDDVILKSYEILLDKYYPKNKSFLGILQTKMYYAGPKEAIQHALIRRNYGCTHMIIGRDHAGVGDYYDSYASHNIFDQFKKDELGIEILKYENVSHCNVCDELTSSKSCGHNDEEKLFLSGTKVRELINNKEKLPKKLIRSEVAEFLFDHADPFVK